MTYKHVFSGLLLAISLAIVSAGAQSRVGTVQGTVKDPNGALVPNAIVTVTEPLTGYKQSATTDAQGQFRLVNIPFHTYVVRAEASGFQPAEQSIHLESTVPLNLDIAVTLESATANVTVSASRVNGM